MRGTVPCGYIPRRNRPYPLEGTQTMNKPFRYKLNIFLFLLPALLLFVGVLIAPIIMSTIYSFTEWNGFTTPEFIGFKNYVELFTSRSINIQRALKNAFLLAILSCCIQLPFALWLALRLSRPIKGKTAFLSIIGLDKLTRIWLGNKKTALGAAFVPILWQYVGYHMLLMYAGIKGVPVELTEAAMLDGCTEAQVSRYIVIPYIRPILRVSVIFAITGSLKSFDLIYVLTNGGPNHATEVPSTLMISMLFLRNRYGMGSTIAVMLIILCFVFALLINMLFKEEK